MLIDDVAVVLVDLYPFSRRQALTKQPFNHLRSILSFRAASSTAVITSCSSVMDVFQFHTTIILPFPSLFETLRGTQGTLLNYWKNFVRTEC